MESPRFFIRLPVFVAPALLSALALTSPPASAQLYCCQNSLGRKVCSNTMPTDCVGRDTTVKSDRGVRQIEGALTPEERARREAAALSKKQDEEARKEQRRKDLALLNTYSNVKDIDVARARAEDDVQSQIKAADAKIAAAAARRKKLEAEVDFYKGKTLPEELRRGLKDTEFEIKAQGELIETKKKDLENLQAKYTADKKRYEELAKARVAGPR